MPHRHTAPDVGRRSKNKAGSDSATPRNRALVVGLPAPLRETVLRALGEADVEWARTGVEAVAKARSRKPTVVVLNSQLHDAPSDQVIPWIRSVPGLSELSFIVLSEPSGSGRSSLDPGVHTIRPPITSRSLANALRVIFEPAR